MRHARPDDLDTIEALLEQLRKIVVLNEKKRGKFYRGSKTFLHFHEHEGAMLADVKSGKVWERHSAARKDWPKLMKRVKELAL
jgi:hypothetical protein